MSQYISAYNEDIDETYRRYAESGKFTVGVTNTAKSLRISSPNESQQLSVKSLMEVLDVGQNVNYFSDYCFTNISNLSAITSSGKILDCGTSCFTGTSGISWMWFKGMNRGELVGLIQRTQDADWPKNKVYFYGSNKHEEGSFVWPITGTDLSSFIGGQEVEQNLSTNGIYLVYQGETLSTNFKYDGQNHQPYVISVMINNESVSIERNLTSNKGDVYIDYCMGAVGSTDDDHIVYGGDVSCIGAGTHYVELVGLALSSSKNYNGSIRVPFYIEKGDMSYEATPHSGKWTDNPRIIIAVQNPTTASQYFRLSGETEWNASLTLPNETSSYNVEYKILPNNKNFNEVSGFKTIDVEQSPFWLKLTYEGTGSVQCINGISVENEIWKCYNTTAQITAYPGANCDFEKWSDGGYQCHTVSTSQLSTEAPTYTATFKSKVSQVNAEE